MKMTPEEFRERMKDLAFKAKVRNNDLEGTHFDADWLMGEVLKELGYGEGVQIFRNMPKWYV